MTGTAPPTGLQSPAFSVVVTVVDGGETLARCLQALREQEGAPTTEIIVPVDRDGAAAAWIDGLERRFPEVRFLATGVAGPAADASEFAKHVRYDRRRSAGLRAARAPLVAMVEDRGWPRHDWVRAMCELHAAHPHAGIGGAIENGAPDALRRAAYFCDFGRYEPPFATATAEYVSDTNICYKRAALDAVRSTWIERYQEVQVHDALRRDGAGLLLSDRARVVQERAPMALGAALAERVHWARTYAHIRARGGGRLRQLCLALGSPALALILPARHVRRQRAAGRGPFAIATTLPATVLLMAFWALGECIGYLEAALGARAALPHALEPAEPANR